MSRSSWTVDTLKAYVDTQLADRDQFLYRLAAERDKQVDAAFDTANRAVLKQEAATEKRFQSVNEFRAQLADQARDFMPRKEYEVQHEALIERIAMLERDQSSLGGRNQGTSSALNIMVVVISAIAIAVTIVVAVVTH